MDLDAYRAFVLICEQGSISAAARILRLPRPTVSRRLSALEEQLGTRLLQRGPRSIRLTRAGREFHERVRGAIDAIDAAERDLLDRSTTPRGVLRVAIAPLVLRRMEAFVLRFREDFPEVSLQIVAEDRLADLREEAIDVAIRSGHLGTPDLIQRRLTVAPVHLYAAPDYLAAHGRPERPEDLASHRLLRGTGATGTPRRWWPLRTGERLAVDGDFTTNDRMLLRRATVEGHGISLLTALHAERYASTGALVPVLVEHVGVDLGIHVVYPERALLPPRTRAFIDATVDFFKAGLPPETTG